MASTSTVARVCLVGYGRMGEYRAQLLLAHPRLLLAAVVDPTAAPDGGVLGAGVPHFGSVLEALVKGGPYDCLWVASPTRHHADVILAAAQYSRPPRVIFCEKPIAGAVLSVAHCYHVCRRRGVRLVCGWMRRLDAGYALLARQVAERRAAGVELACAELVSDDWPAVERRFLRSLGSIFEDLMCHDFNAAEYFMADALPLWLEAEAHSSCNDDLPDCASCTVFFDRPPTGAHRKHNASSSSAAAGGGTVFKMTASRVSRSGTYENSVALRWEDGTTAECGTDLRTHSFFERHDRSYRAEVDLVADVLAGTRSASDSTSTPLSCLLTAALVELAEESARLGGKRLYLDRPFLVALHAIASEHTIALASKL